MRTKAASGRKSEATAAQATEALAEASERKAAAATAAAAASKEELTSERRIKKYRDEQILAIIRKRKTIKKKDKQHIREGAKRSRSASGPKKELKDENTKNTGRSERNEEHPEHEICEKTNPQIENQKIITSRKGIADVPGEFHEKLRDDDGENEKEIESEEKQRIPGVRPPREFRSSQRKRFKSIDRQKRGKAGDSSGSRAEHIKRCDRETKEWIRQFDNEILQQENCTPQTWRRIRRKVIHKVT